MAVKVQNPKRATDAHGHEEHARRVRAYGLAEGFATLRSHLDLEEYRAQVPLEFDFKREAQMLTLIGDAIHGKVPDVETPKAIPELCTGGW